MDDMRDVRHAPALRAGLPVHPASGYHYLARRRLRILSHLFAKLRVHRRQIKIKTAHFDAEDSRCKTRTWTRTRIRPERISRRLRTRGGAPSRDEQGDRRAARVRVAYRTCHPCCPRWDGRRCVCLTTRSPLGSFKDRSKVTHIPPLVPTPSYLDSIMSYRIWWNALSHHDFPLTRGLFPRRRSLLSKPSIPALLLRRKPGAPWTRCAGPEP